MKKAYSKPDVMYESFSMCTSIANGVCSVRANQKEDVCGVELTSDITIFTGSASGCNLKYADGQYDGLCYHVPFDGTGVFYS